MNKVVDNKEIALNKMIGHLWSLGDQKAISQRLGKQSNYFSDLKGPKYTGVTNNTRNLFWKLGVDPKFFDDPLRRRVLFQVNEPSYSLFAQPPFKLPPTPHAGYTGTDVPVVQSKEPGGLYQMNLHEAREAARAAAQLRGRLNTKSSFEDVINAVNDILDRLDKMEGKGK